MGFTTRAARALPLAIAVLAFAGTASAQTDLERARAVFEQGAAHYENQNYALALQAFQESYDLLDGHPRQALVLYNVGRCYEELGRFRDARDAYQRYLREAADDAQDRGQVEERLRELETRVSLDETETGRAAPSRDAAAPGTASGEASGGSGLLTAGIVTLAVGGAGLASFGSFGGLALGEYGTLEDRCGGSCSEQDVSTLSTFNTVADISLGVGVAAVIAGTVLVIIGASEGGEESSSARVAPWLTPDGGGASVGGMF